MVQSGRPKRRDTILHKDLEPSGPSVILIPSLSPVKFISRIASSSCVSLTSCPAFAWHDVSLKFSIKGCFLFGRMRTLGFRTTPSMAIRFVGSSHVIFSGQVTLLLFRSLSLILVGLTARAFVLRIHTFLRTHTFLLRHKITSY